MESQTEQSKDDARRQYRLERLAELGVTEEAMTKLGELMAKNGYKVDTEYFISFYPEYKTFADQPKVYLTFNNNLVYMTNSSSHWDINQSREILAQTQKALDLMDQIAQFAPTLIDPTFRDKEYERKNAEHKAALLAKIEKWNALPKEEVLLPLPSGGKIILERHTVKYDQNYGTRFTVNLKLINADGTEEGHSFWTDNYVTKSGGVQRKKFLEHNTRMLPADVETILDNLPRLHKINMQGRRDY